MGLAGGAASPQLVGLDPQTTSRNYMVGPRSQWHLNVPTFGQVYSRTTASGYTATGWGYIGHVALASYRTNAYFACQGGDHALWYSVNPGSGWVQVQSAGGVIADSPAIVTTPAEVIVYIEGSNKAVYHVTLSPGGGPTTPWANDGGSIQFGPGATTLTP